jgi:hypothetical protein
LTQERLRWLTRKLSWKAAPQPMHLGMVVDVRRYSRTHVLHTTSAQAKHGTRARVEALSSVAQIWQSMIFF